MHVDEAGPIQHRAWAIMPLRSLADPGDSRVKAYAKQIRDGVLPPLLLWWVNGFDCHLLLDGHDRLAAAVAAEVEPPQIVLNRVDDDRPAGAVQAYIERVDHLTPYAATAAIAREGRDLARRLREPDHGARTVVRPLPGGAAAWDRLAATAGWDVRPG